MSDLEGAYNDALNAEGSAMRENEAYLESIQGHIDILNNDIQTMWMNFMDSDVVKWVVHLLDLVVKLVDQFGLLRTAVVGFGTKFIFKNFDKMFGGLFNKTSKSNIIDDAKNKVTAQEITNSENSKNAQIQDAQEVKNKKVQADAEELTADEMKTQGEITNSEESKNAQIQDAQEVQQQTEKTAMSFKKLGQTIKKALVSMAISYAITRVFDVFDDITNALSDDSANTFEELNEEYTEYSGKLSECESELSSLESQLETTNKQIEELESHDELTFVEKKELERLRDVSDELERQVDIVETLQDSLQIGTAAAAEKAGSAYLNTSFSSEKSKTQRQEETAESWGKSGEYAGNILGAGAGWLAGAQIGSVGGPAGALIGLLIGGIIGEIAGSAAGAASAGEEYDSEETIAQAISRMNMTRDQLIKARDEAYEAYAKAQMDTMVSANYKEANNNLLTYDQNMAKHIGQISQYYSSIMSSWSSMDDEQRKKNSYMLDAAKSYGDMIDKYNVMMGGKNAKVNAIDRIFGEEASEEIKNVKAALEQMYDKGEKISLENAFGNNTDGYKAFVARLREMGIYVYELEDSFYQLKVAEEEAAQVDFSDIVKDVVKTQGAINGLKTALDEFMEDGTATTGTLLDLEQYFTATDDLKDLYNKYLDIMLSGNTSIKDAKDATAELAKAYLEEVFSSSDISTGQIATYTKLLEELGIDNADELIAQQVKKSAYNAMSSEFNRNYNVDKWLGDGDASTEDLIDVDKYVEKYGINQEYATNMAKMIAERKTLENDLNQANAKMKAYGEAFKDYKQAQEEYDTDGPIAMYYKSQYDSYDLESWKKQDFRDYSPRKNVKTGEVLSSVDYLNMEKEANSWLDQYDTIYQKAKATLDKLRTDDNTKDFFDANGNFIESAKEQIQDEIDAAQIALDAMDAKIQAEFFLDYDIKFKEDKIENTISAIKSQIEEHNNLSATIDEISFDGVRISEDVYGMLLEQLKDVTVGTEDFFDAIDTSNGYVVKNARLLKQLAQQSNKASVAAAKQAKSQAMLKYYELSKELSENIMVTKLGVRANEEKVSALNNEMNALEKIISTYSRLESELNDVAEAYNNFELAQQTDADTDYIGSVEGMILSLGEAFNSGELGTETAQVAIANLVPESVYKDLDTVEEKMAAIHKYFKEGKLSEYFDINFDEDGNIESAEMKLGNLRKFIEDGLGGDNNGDGINVFEGADWQHFEFSKEFLAGLDGAPDKLQYFADQMNVTKEVAFAFIESLNDHDIEWLNGDYSSLFDSLFPETLEGDIYKTTKSIAELKANLANGSITTDEYNDAMYGLWGQYKSGKISLEDYNSRATELFTQYENGTITLNEYHRQLFGLSQLEEDLEKQAEESALTWAEKKSQIEENTALLDKYQQILADGPDANGNYTLDGETISGDELIAKIDEISKATDGLLDDLEDLEEPTEVVIQMAINSLQSKIDEIESELGYNPLKGGQVIYNEATTMYEVSVDKDSKDYELLQQFADFLNQKQILDVELGEDAPTVLETVQELSGVVTNIRDILLTAFNLEIDTSGAVTKVNYLQSLIDKVRNSSFLSGVVGWFTGAQGVNGTAHVSGTAHASGDWGLPENEHNALVGELGPEIVVDPNSGRYYTVGDTGAEMVDLPKGAIIFNHKQTEGLLKNGYVTSRGKAYAEGNAHVTIWPNASSNTQWEGTGYDGPNDSTWSADAQDLSSALNSAAGSVEEFEETIDFIEIRMEELDEALSRYSAKLENATTVSAKNDIIDKMIEVNRDVYSNAIEGARYYEQHAEKYLEGMSDELVAAAKNGAISIEEFTKESDEATIKAIQNYRDYSSKAADLYQQAEETIATIRDLAIQRVDNAYEYGSVIAGVEDSQTEKLQNAVDYDEERGLITSDAYYRAMMENSNKKIEYLTNARNTMQEELNAAVRNGEVIRGSKEWYELLDKMYQVDAEIDEATIELEEFQNAINDLYWDNFDQLINRLDHLKDETQNLIDLMDSEDMVTKPEGRTYEDGTIKYWTADDVNWTDEGLASLGLYAQQMEIAEYQARQYAEAIDDLTADYEAGLYSENEYLDKLNELQSAQYDSIEAYYDAEDAIVELNKARIDSIKDGIAKEIEAYEELIDKKKEELDAEKDLFDFQKGVMDQQKNISDIERKLAALSLDNSASARAKRAQLEAELYEAREQLEESYYDRSISNQQEALDKELESFKEEKDAEVEALEEYLENVKQVVTDSLNIVKDNATEIGQTLTEKANEYNLTVSDAVLSPWQDGALAVSEYQNAFDTAISSTTDQLELLKNAWQEVIDRMAEAGQAAVDAFNAENAAYAEATLPEPEQEPEQEQQPEQDSQEGNITVGSKINAGNARIYASSSGTGGGKQYFASDPIYTVIQEKNGYLLVRHHKSSSGVSGWFKKSDVKAYAKGTIGTKEDELAWVDELGEELQLVPGENGRLAYIQKGTGIIPADLTSNLMKWGKLDPQDMLDRNRPTITPSNSVVNTEISINMNIAEVVHVDHVDSDTLPDLTKLVKKEMDSYMTKVNNAIKSKVR